MTKLFFPSIFIIRGHSSGSDHKRQHQKAAAKLGTAIPSFIRSRGSEQSEDDKNIPSGSSSRPLSKRSLGKESTNNLSAVARPDLLENAIVLADYQPSRVKRQNESASSIERQSCEQNIEEGLEASNVALQEGTPKRENPFHKSNL